MSTLHPAFVEKWTPVVELYDKRRAPSHAPFSFEILSKKAYDQTSAWPGRRHNVRLLETSPDAFLYEDALPGQSPFKPRLLMLDYDLIFRDSGAAKWLLVTGEKEAQARSVARAHYQNIVDDLEEIEAEKKKDGKDLDDEQKRQLAGARDMLAQLQNDTTSFLETHYHGAFGTWSEFIKWSLSVPNVPIDLICKETIGQDRAVTLRCEFSAPPDDQGDFTKEFHFTDGTTDYALVFADGGSVEWRHYRNMKASLRRQKEEELSALLDRGRLTGADREQIRNWRELADNIKEKAKAEGRDASKMTPQEKGQIKFYRDAIEQLQQSKRGLTGEDERRRAELLKTLYYTPPEPVNLQEDSKSFYNRVFDVTVMFHRRGFVSVRLDKNPPWVWQNKAIAKLRGYNQMLPARSRVLIRSTGGAFAVALGRPRFKKEGMLYTADFVPGFDIASDDYIWEFDADFVETQVEDGAFVGIGPFGTRVEAKLVKVVSKTTKAGLQVPSKYQLQLTLKPDADGVYSPEIHYVNLQVLAGETPPRSDLRWTNLPSGDRHAKQLVRDVLSQDAEDTTPLYEIYVDDNGGRARMPHDLVYREAVVKLLRMSDGREFKLLQNGVTKRAELHERRNLWKTVADFLRIRARAKSDIKIHAVGMEDVLNREIRYPIIGNGKYPNDFIRQMLRNAGLREDEYEGVPAGDIGIRKIKLAAAGRPPEVRPDKSARYWEYIQEIVKKFCPGWRFVVRAEGCVLERDAVRDRPDLDYRTDRKATDPLAIRRGFQVFQDLEEYFTEAVFTGAVNPQTGQRWSRSKSIPEATDERFEGASLLHVGTPRPHIAEPDDTLIDADDCTQAARTFMDKYGRPPWYLVMNVAYNPDVRCGDLICADGFRVVVENIARGSLYADRGEAPRMTITARFYDDVAIGEVKD
jgi:hypothetical protein